MSRSITVNSPPRWIADALVEQFLEARGGLSGKVRIHWDDCTEDERSFWFCFQAPELGAARAADSPLMRSLKSFIRECKRAALRRIEKESAFTGEWSSHDAPVSEYLWCDYKKRFAGYSQDHWMLRLDFYGGPDAVSIAELLGKRKE